MSRNWLHTPDCKVLNESTWKTYEASEAIGCLSTQTILAARQNHTELSLWHTNWLLDNSQRTLRQSGWLWLQATSD